MKQIEANIMGQSYMLACPDDGEAAFSQAVARVDREMCLIRDSGRIKARERMAVLAALNIAFEGFEPVAPAAAASAANDRPEPANQTIDQTLERLIERIDIALGQDGHLL